MKPLFIFRHIECEGPGYFASVLSNLEIPFRIIAIDQHNTIPASTADCSGLVFMGGPMSVNDPLPWIGEELQLIREGQARDLPILGHCLGGQLISKALGGNITANAIREIGWHPVRKCRTALATDWLPDLDDAVEMFHWHGETFSIPEGAGVILENDHCAHQAFALGNTLALQCHVEMTAPMVREWASLYQHELQDPAPSVQSREQMTANLQEKVTRLQQSAEQLYLRWLQPLLGTPIGIPRNSGKVMRQ